MANSKAQAAKDKGNIAFKSGDYPAAIGSYTAAILADRNDPTFPLNRAAAYLKLGKNEDAERDCATVLLLNSSNVKALFRRGQARVGMGKLREALQDFTEALNHEPTNTSVKEELRKVSDLIENQKSKKAKSSVTSTPIPAVSPKRRRIPIKIIDPADTPSAPSQPTQLQTSTSPSQVLHTGPTSGKSAANDLLKPVSSRQLNPLSSPTNSPPDRTPQPSRTVASPTTPLQKSPKPNPRTFQDAKQARENTKPSRVGGGIFRASGNNTIFPTRESTTIPPRTRPIFTPSGVKTELTWFDFTKAWESSFSVEERWRLISSVPPSSLPAMFQTSLEPSLFISILEVFLQVISGSESSADALSAVREYMNCFSNVPRFGTVLLLLMPKEKDTVGQVWRELGVETPDGVWSVIATHWSSMRH